MNNANSLRIRGKMNKINKLKREKHHKREKNTFITGDEHD